MRKLSLSPTVDRRPPSHRRRLAYAVALAGAVLAAAVPAGAGADSPPTAPPPITIVTPGADNHNGDIFISPFGDSDTYANGPEILDNHGHVVWFHAVPAGQEAADFRTQTYHGQPVLTWWQGTGLGGLAQGTDYIYNDHYQQIATVQAGNGLSADGHEFLITPLEHGADPRLHHRHRRPDLDRRPGQPDGDRRRRPGDRHPDRPGALPVEQRRPRPLQRQRAAAAGIAQHAVGLVPHQRRAPGVGRQPADRRPGHLDDLRREPAQRRDQLAARRQGQHLHPEGRARAGAGQRGRDLRLAARPRAGRARTRSRSSTTMRRAPYSCRTAGR